MIVHLSMPYLIQFVPSFSFFGIFIRDSLPCRIISCTADEIAVLANENEKKDDNAVKARQADKIAEKK
jgi:hypothetical protein